MSNWLGYKCVNCLHEIESFALHYICPLCSHNLDIIYNYSKISSLIDRNYFYRINSDILKKYNLLMPLDIDTFVTNLRVGNTPLYRLTNIEKIFGVNHIYGKDETKNPSSSFKDRASLVAIAKAIEYKYKTICGASTGNAAASLACLSTQSNIKTKIFVPQNAPIAKIAQLLVYGARVFPVHGTYDSAFDLSIEASNKYNWYNRNTGYNPFTREGKKTCSYEIAEQTNFSKIDYIFIPTGDGNILTGIYKGFYDLLKTNIIDFIPKLVAVQAQNSSAIVKAFNSGGKIEKDSGNTIADSISVSLPRDGEFAITALKNSNGFAISVSDEEIIEAIFKLAKNTGIFVEPAGAASFAGFIKAHSDGIIKSSDVVVLLLTGSGLKDTKSVMDNVKMPELICV